MRYQNWKKILCVALSVGLLATAAGCGSSAPSQNLMADYQKDTSSVSGGDGGVEMSGNGDNISSGAELLYRDGAVAVSDFGLRLLRECYEENENVMISPLSVMSALGMTVNGARKETLVQMEQVLGMETSALNMFLKEYRESLPNSEKYKVNLANAIWFKDTPVLEVDKDFLQSNADYYNSGIFKAVFDESTKNEINKWVDENTDGMIKQILDEIPKEAVMYLVNALAFEGEWQNTYSNNRVRESEFTKADGSRQNVEMMHSEEYSYLQDENAQGFLKLYADGKYAFVGILPNEGISVADYLKTLDGEKLQGLLKKPETVKVKAGIPKFKNEYSVEMNAVLQTLGMELPFDSNRANFDGIGRSSLGNLYISKVLHKTFIEVDELGTKAAAVTSVEMALEAARVEEEVKTVILDRPFVYMIIDCENQIPLFMGTVTNMSK